MKGELNGASSRSAAGKGPPKAPPVRPVEQIEGFGSALIFPCVGLALGFSKNFGKNVSACCWNSSRRYAHHQKPLEHVPQKTNLQRWQTEVLALKQMGHVSALSRGMRLSVLFNYTNPAPSDHRKPRGNRQKQPKIDLLAPPGSCWLPGSSWLPNKMEILI
jgi:hypothetical protein